MLVPVYSAKGFAEAILALASDESMRRRMGASGSELIRTSYSWDSAMRKPLNYTRPLSRRENGHGEFPEDTGLRNGVLPPGVRIAIVAHSVAALLGQEHEVQVCSPQVPT